MIAHDTNRHPCFDKEAKGKFGRMHLPIAPKCNVQCNFCDRKFDCMNETRPGVCSAVLSPHQALYYVDNVLENDPRISVVGIAGPGDPFANIPEVVETISLIRDKHPHMIFCLSSNGLAVPDQVDKLVELNVSHVTITVNAVDPEIGAKIYAWIRDGKRVYRGVEGATLLWERQKEAIQKLHAAGMVVKINSIFIKGVNDHHLTEIARVTGELGGDTQNIIPLLPVENTPFSTVEPPRTKELVDMRNACEPLLTQMRHCARCRADAVGILGEPNTQECVDLLEEASKMPLRPEQDRPYVAVASHEGLLVNQHLGEAKAVWVFEKDGDGMKLREQRICPPVGGGDQRWKDLANQLDDCVALLVSGIGPKPTQLLMNSGLRVVPMEGLIETAVLDILAGRKISSPVRKFKCGASCAGTGTGCG